MKKVNFEDYKIRLIDSLNYIEEKKLIKILNIFTKKIIKKKIYLFVGMVDPQQFQIIIYVIF